MNIKEKCKLKGTTVAELSKSLGLNKNGHPLVSQQTLRNWEKDKPALFDIVLDGHSYRSLMKRLDDIDRAEAKN